MTEHLTETLPQVERRVEERHVVDEEEGCCHLTVAVGCDGRPAKVKDVSIQGARLIVDHPFLPGTVITITLANTAGFCTRTLRMRVRHVLEREDGRYFTGGDFVNPLNQDELQTLLEKG